MRSAVPSKLQAAALPALGDVLEFMRVIWELDHALQRTSKSMHARLGVTGPQRLVIRIVGRFPGIPAGQLAALLHVHPSTLTGILKRLEHGGLVRRHSDPHDARRSLLGLTNKGRAFDTDSAGTIESCIADALEHTPGHKIEAARELLGGIAQRLADSTVRPVRSTRARPSRKRSGAR